MWCSPLTSLHSKSQTWELEGTTTEEVKTQLLSAALANAKKFQFTEPTVQDNTVQLFAYTKAEWLDVMEFDLEQQGSKVLVKVRTKPRSHAAVVGTHHSFTSVLLLLPLLTLVPCFRHALLQAHSFSSGFVPVSIPGAPLFNMVSQKEAERERERESVCVCVCVRVCV